MPLAGKPWRNAAWGSLQRANALPACLPVLQSTRESDGLWKAADALLIDKGADNEDELYSKSAALQTWLLGYEFPETVMAICAKKVLVLTSKKKGA